jgi:type I restriction enzyme, S subunit
VSWPLAHLSSLCEINMGKTPSRHNAAYWGDEHPWLSIADMNQGLQIFDTKESITQKAVDECNCKPVEPGTVLLSFKLSIGKVGIANRKLFTNEAIAALPVKNPSQLDTNYLAYALRSIDLTEGLDRAAKGLTLNKDKLERIKVPLPPLPEQRRIAVILDQADALRTKRREALAQLDSLTQSIFIEMFGDPVRNEKKLPTFPFEEIAIATQGIQIPRGEQIEEQCDGYERYLYINDFYSDSSPKYIVGRYPQKRVTEIDLVMANTGSPGRVFRGRPGILSNNLFRISFDTTTISTKYFFQFLASDRFQQHLKGQMKQGIQSHLGHKTFGKQLLPLPPMSLQIEFSSRIAGVEQLKYSQQSAQRELDTLFSSLQHRAFRGEL